MSLVLPSPQHTLLHLPGSLRACKPLDLSRSVPGLDLSQRPDLFRYIAAERSTAPHGVLIGGYLERRRVYAQAASFAQPGEFRDIHLGIDVWADAQSPILAPLEGRIVAFADNTGFSNYGPTIILRHELEAGSFHTLYGHLSRRSLSGLATGQRIGAGERVGWLGEPAENGEWPPHLHFQVIVDLPDDSGDYPGVCAEAQLEFYRSNCPDPKALLK